MIVKERAQKVPGQKGSQTKYEPCAAEKTLLNFCKILREGKYKQLTTPCVALRGKSNDFSLQGVLADLMRTVDWTPNDPVYATPTLEGYAFELPLSCIDKLSRDGLVTTEIIQLIELCYTLDYQPNQAFVSSADEIEKLVNGWIKEKRNGISLTQSDWEEIYLVCGSSVDLLKGKLTATDWKTIAKLIGAYGRSDEKKSWKGYIGTILKKIGTTGERAAAQYKVVPTKYLSDINKLRATPLTAAKKEFLTTAKVGW